MESEYYAIDECAKHCLWYKNIFKELNMNIKYTEIKTYNKATIQNCIDQTINLNQNILTLNITILET